MAQIIFTLTIFVSAFLLFLVQPLVGKLILPKLGGTPQVWNTCMVFFQSALLLGYAYTHSVTTRLKLRQQLMLHSAILLIPIVILLMFPIYDTVHAWNPPAGSNPIAQTLLLLAIIIGVPFFVVSTSAPLLQRWFGYSGHMNAKDPYFLYSASNAGSLLSLLFYPAIIEPFTFLQTQSYIWLGGYIVLAALIMYCAYMIYHVAPSDAELAAEAAASEAPPPAPMEAPEAAVAPAVELSTAVKSGAAPGMRGLQRKKGARVPGKFDDDRMVTQDTAPDIERGANAEMTWWRRIRWVLLAAVPSSMMLGVTSYISTDLSPFPLVWIIPLSLYLLSFILVYMKGWTGKRLQLFGPPGYSLHQMIVYVAQPLGLMALCLVILTHEARPFVATTLTMLGFFASALACHGELAEDRPSTKHLTEYFLMMSLGGALGGIFNGIFAPIMFQGGVYEFYIVIVVACFIRPQYVQSGWFDELILQAFPGLQTWSRNQGDEMAKSMGRPAPHTTYLFNIFLDIVFGLFILSISYWLRSKAYEGDWVSRIMKFLAIPREWGQQTLTVFLYGIPMVFCFFFAGRPLRLGLAVMGLLLGSLYLGSRDDDNIIEARRTYFGVLRVMKGVERTNDPEEAAFFTEKQLIQNGEPVTPRFNFTYLMHGTTYHGRNYIYDPQDPLSKHFKDLSRLASTYYHRYGPVGIVMEQDNYLAGPQNSFYTDYRMPASIIGQITAALGSGNLPLPAMLEPWSDPPFATIGLGTGTMATYARPYQHMTYYEIDDVIRGFSLPDDGVTDGHFTYLQNAIRRGVNLEVIMGDARQSLQADREVKNSDNAYVYFGDFAKVEPKLMTKPRAYANAPYTMVHRVKDDVNTMSRESYYKAINVDAFSSDAIPVHLITLQAIKLYMSKLREDGVLCVHTSNRHMDLVRPVARIALELGLGCIVGKDGGDKEKFMGHFSSEYVMLYNKEGGFDRYLDKLKDEKEKIGNGPAPNGKQILNSVVVWYDPYRDHVEFRGGRAVKAPITKNDSLWTDDYSYILGVLR